MDGIPISPSLPDYSNAQARNIKGQAKKSKPNLSEEHPPGVSPLVDADRLFLFVEPEDHVGAEAEAAFRRAFQAVWAAIPVADRRLLLDRWRDPALLYFAEKYKYHPLRSYRPVICLCEMPYSAGPTCDAGGAVLLVPAWLAREEPERLPAEVTHLLARAYQFADRSHGGLILDQIEHLTDRWERRRGGGGSETARDRKLDELEEAYLRRYETEMNQILRRWGCQEPFRLSPRAPGGDREDSEA